MTIRRKSALTTTTTLGSAAIIFAALAPEARAEPLVEAGPFALGGAIRGNVVYRDFAEPDEFDDLFEFDTVLGNVDFAHEQLIGSAQARTYYFHQDGEDHSTGFIHHGWLGWRFPDGGEVQAGVTKVPFGLLPFASDNWFFSIAFYLGLEDDYDLGLKYVSPVWDGWNVQAAWFPTDEGSGWGRSTDSARYSYDFVDDRTTDRTNANDESHQFNLRVSRALFPPDLDYALELGASLEYGLLDNVASGDTGDHWAGALHARAAYGRFGLDLEAIRYQIDQATVPGADDRIVRMGAFDFPFDVATEGTIWIANLRYNPEIEIPLFDDWTVYNNFSVVDKDEDDFKDTYHNVTGAYFSRGPWLLTLDIVNARGSPFGTRDFLRGLGTGGEEWDTRINLNVALYFL